LLPPGAYNSFRYLFGRILYNAGRILTYTLLGAGVGLIGEQFGFFMSQKTLTIAIGVLFLSYLISDIFFKKHIPKFNSLYFLTNKLKKLISGLYKNYSLLTQFAFGLINGLLPCGLVYAALAAAFIMSNWNESALSMTFFGLGTLPLMLPLSLGAHSLRKLIGTHFQKILRLSYLLIGVWLIYRGFVFDTNNLYTAPGKEIEAECITPVQH
jgi:sulfite exporter TauE/SafE